MSIATAKVEGRRKLHFDKIEEIQAEVERLARGEVRALGNWSPGQILEHLAIAMKGSIDGFQHKAPLPIRILGKFIKGRLLNKPMSAGFKLPKKSAQEFVPGPTSWEDGLADLRTAMRRLLSESQRRPSPLLGEMTKEEWNKLHCRHAELHLSFLEPVN